MSTLLVQAIAVIFAASMIYLSHIYFKKKIFSAYDFILWASAWLFFMAVSAFPKSVSFVVQTLDFIDARQLIIIAGLAFIVLMVFYLFGTVRKYRKKFEELVSKMSLEKIENENSDNRP